MKVDSEKTAIVVDSFDRLVNDHKINLPIEAHANVH